MSSSTPTTDRAPGANEDRTLGKVIDGKAIARGIRAELARELAGAALAGDAAHPPGLAVLLVGSRKDSQTYVRMKQKACAECGMASFLRTYENVDAVDLEARLLAQIDDWNADDRVHGILVQLPLPAAIDEARVLGAVAPAKDVDGLHPANAAALFRTATHRGTAPAPDWRDFASVPFHVPCTPQGCVELLDRVGVPIAGARAVVLGRSNLVGLPVAMLLCHRDATVTVAHSRTRDVAAVVKRADIVVAAAGRAHMVPAAWLKEGCCVIDVGINSVDDPTAKRGDRKSVV